MSATITAPEAKVTIDPGAQVTEVRQVPDQLRQEIVAAREGGATLAELKRDFGPQVHIDVIRELLPAGNKREAKQREAKEAKPTEVTQGVGGRSGKAKSEPKTEAPKPEPKAPRYVEDNDLLANLSERALACRQVMGRGALAEALDTTQSAVWRAERGKIHPSEVDALQAGLKRVEERIAAGEFVKQEKAPKAATPTKVELLHRMEAAVFYLREGTKGLSGKAVAEATLALLDPPTDS